MAKHSRGRYRRNRRWYKNVGDPIDIRKGNGTNPNDVPLPKK